MKKIAIFTLACLTPFFARAEEISIDINSALAMLAAIKEYGAKQVLHQREISLGWDKIVDHIGSGDEKWLEVADGLVCCTDAYASETMPIALSLALTHSPEAVLQRLKDMPDKHHYDVKSVCDVPFFEPTKKEFDLHLKALKRALRKVTKPELQDIKNKCSKNIASSRYGESER